MWRDHLITQIPIKHVDFPNPNMGITNNPELMNMQILSHKPCGHKHRTGPNILSINRDITSNLNPLG